MDISMIALAEGLSFALAQTQVRDTLIQLNHDPNSTAANLKIQVLYAEPREHKVHLEILFDYHTRSPQVGVRDLLVRLIAHVPEGQGTTTYEVEDVRII